MEVEELIGFFVNTLVMRGDLSGDPTFRELLARTREAALGAYANQDIPFERIVDAVHPERDLSRSPIFQVLFILQNTPIAPLALSELTLRQLDVDAGAAKFDITLSLVAGEAGYTGHLEYNTDLFDAATIERMAGHFVTLLEGVAANPELRLSQLPVLTRTEQRLMLEEWNDTDDRHSDGRVHPPPVRGTGRAHAERGRGRVRGGRAHLPRARCARQSARAGAAEAWRRSRMSSSASSPSGRSR